MLFGLYNYSNFCDGSTKYIHMYRVAIVTTLTKLQG